MKIKIVYFVYVFQEIWKDIVQEQLGQLEKTELYKIADEIIITANCDNEQEKEFQEFINANWPKIQIQTIDDKNNFEYIGMKKIWDISQACEDCLILYFHTKGTTHKKNKYNINSPSQPKNIRKILFDNTILNYKQYLTEFEKNKKLNIGGTFINKTGISWYNFFWVRSSFVKYNLIFPEIQESKYYWEGWIGKTKNMEVPITYSPITNYEKLQSRVELRDLHIKVWEKIKEGLLQEDAKKIETKKINTKKDILVVPEEKKIELKNIKTDTKKINYQNVNKLIENNTIQNTREIKNNGNNLGLLKKIIKKRNKL
jgi:hypothetical protein